MKKILLMFLLLFTMSFSADKVNIEIFTRKDCKNCVRLEEFLTELSKDRNDFTVTKYDINEDKSAREFFDEVTKKGKLVKGTPVIYLNETIIQGFDSGDTTGKDITELIESGKVKDTIPGLKVFIENYDPDNINTSYTQNTCEGDEVCAITPVADKKSYVVTLPLLNKKVDVMKYSLPSMSFILGTIDGFNPCAMWVLILFLTALIAIGDKKKMFLVAGLFIFAEAVMYYLILNIWIFTWDFIGLNRVITPLVGLIGIIGGILFIKSYIKNRNEIACEVGDFEKKAKISGKIQDLAHKPFTILTGLGIITLALSVNVIEFACSIGIPQTYTKILEMNTVSFLSRQVYNLIYIIGYMIDDFVVFALALFSINKIASTGKYSKLMNLFGGILMVILGLMLIIKPEILVF